MKTVIETETFNRKSASVWSEDDRLEFITYISQNPLSGDVIPGADGTRKIRWAIRGTGKRGGVRIIYFNIDVNSLLLIDLYKKSNQSNVTSKEIRRARDET